MMERRMRSKSHVRCGAGENLEITSKDYLSLFLQVAQGKTLSMQLVRAGRAMNAGVYFVTQNTDDLLDEKLNNNLGLNFAFRDRKSTRLNSSHVANSYTVFC